MLANSETQVTGLQTRCGIRFGSLLNVQSAMFSFRRLVALTNSLLHNIFSACDRCSVPQAACDRCWVSQAGGTAFKFEFRFSDRSDRRRSGRETLRRPWMTGIFRRRQGSRIGFGGTKTALSGRSQLEDPFSRPRHPFGKTRTARYSCQQTGFPDHQIGIPNFW
jgi:hypothetical protein